jgi:hypothetical protein
LKPEYCHRCSRHSQKVNIIGFISSHGVGNIEVFEETMNQHVLKRLLNNNLLASAKRLYGNIITDWWHLHDNDKKFHAPAVNEWCFNHGIQNLDFPPYSPDLNPIEHVWSDLKRRVESRNPHNIQDLKLKIVDEWNKTSPTLCCKLVSTMRKRCEKVIANHGFRTKY